MDDRTCSDGKTRLCGVIMIKVGPVEVSLGSEEKKLPCRSQRHTLGDVAVAPFVRMGGYARNARRASPVAAKKRRKTARACGMTSAPATSRSTARRSKEVRGRCCSNGILE